MNRWLEKIGNAPDTELTKLTKGDSVSSVSAPSGAFKEKNASDNRWLAKLGKPPRHLEEVPPAPQPTMTDESPLIPIMAGNAQATEDAAPPAPLHEVERIIEVLAREQRRDLGPDLKGLIRRAMGPLDRQTRAILAAVIDDVFEHAASIRQAREQADRAIRGKVSDPPPASVMDWLDWIEDRCPINADDRRYIADCIQHLPLAKMATTCRWYAQTWAKAAIEEPSSHRKDNAGRRAANAALLVPRTMQ